MKGMVDPRDRLAQLPADKLRKMFMPQTAPIEDPPKHGVQNIFIVHHHDPKAMMALMLRVMRGG